MPDEDPRTTVIGVQLQYLGGKIGQLSPEAVERLNRLSHDRGYTVKETLELLLIASEWLVEMRR